MKKITFYTVAMSTALLINVNGNALQDLEDETGQNQPATSVVGMNAPVEDTSKKVVGGASSAPTTTTPAATNATTTTATNESPATTTARKKWLGIF